jgi:hypothetical protein
MQKDYDYLLLMGEKDDRYDQYLDNEHDVCFLIPIEEVKNISVSDRTYGSQLNLNTNFATVKTARGKKIIKHMVSCSTIKKLTSKARPY